MLQKREYFSDGALLIYTVTNALTHKSYHSHRSQGQDSIPQMVLTGVLKEKKVGDVRRGGRR